MKGTVMDEEQANRRLAAAKARLILAEASDNPNELVNAMRALRRAEKNYEWAVKYG